MSDQPARKPRRIDNARKWTIGGALTAAASVATILTIFITAGQNNAENRAPASNSRPAGASPSAAGYPVDVQANFLRSCEAGGSPAVCQCDLAWFEQHVHLQRFEQDDAEAARGIAPSDAALAEQACA